MKNIELLKNNGIDIDSSMKLLGSIELYDETLNAFINNINDILTKIKTYKENNDLDNYKVEVYNLKSDSKYLGFIRLAQLAEQHELAIENNDINYVIEHYNELMMEAVRVVNIAISYNNQIEIPESNTKQAIIVADDSNIIRNFINKLLENNFEILPAVDGNEVINIVTQNKDKNIAGMLLDLNMPNVDGFAVLEYFKQNNLFNEIPVSLITGDDTKDSIDRAFKYPIVDMLNKPFNESDLKRIVERTILFHNSIN